MVKRAIAAGLLVATGCACAPVSPMTSPAACLLEMVSSEPRPDPPIPAPAVSPTEGPPGTTVSISGRGVGPGDGVMLIAFFDSPDCSLPGGGRGDHLLGFTTADEGGRYAVTMRWPDRFEPVEGRDLPSGGLSLPHGRYFLLALPCTSVDRSCFVDFNLGSDIGGPFTSGAG